MEIEVTESGRHGAPQPESGSTSNRAAMGRRALLGAGIGGAALSLLPFLSGSAGATPPEEAATTTAPPRRPTTADAEMLGQLQALELTAQALYTEAVNVGGWSDEQAALVSFILEAHRAYGQSLSGLLGRDAPGRRNDELFDAWRADFTGAPDQVLAAAYDLESALVATHTEVLASLEGTNGAASISSMLINEARFCTALADLNGSTDNSELLVDDEADSLVGQG
ncbi:MAG: hypothetical protein Q8M22_15450 [Actinomycetota bacterium]|nr:hypothetical protein [Actinomycetota bacterium]